MKRQYFNRVLWLQVLTACVLLLPLLGTGFYVWTKHQSYLGFLADLEPRYARLAGLLARQADLKTLTEQGNKQLTLLAYPASQDATQAGNDAQQRIRALFAQSKLDIISIQVLPAPKDDAKFDRIPINLRVEGDLAGIQAALTALASQSPTVLLESLSIQTIGAVRPASIQRLGGQFNFFVLRVRP